MALLTPGRRWQPPFYPFKKEKFGKRVARRVERLIKGPLWGCRMCGNCLLQETAFICPMECPKGMRNGPCGGSTPERCYVDETRPCIWYKIYKRSFRMGREQRLLEVLPPLDWDRVGTETWGDVLRSIRRQGRRKFIRSRFLRDREVRKQHWEAVFRPVRQPEWWKGDDLYHPPAATSDATGSAASLSSPGPAAARGKGKALSAEYCSRLEADLRSGKFVITAEVSPPMSTATGKLRRDIEMISPLVSAINFTDAASASPRMSSMACSKVAAELGADPVLQIAARDRTRSGLQSEVIGANVMGVQNVLCITGDNARIGPTPTSNTTILDLDAVQMLWTLRLMRDEGRYLDGRPLKAPPKLFLGAAASPFASEPRFQALREEKKINAGAQFFQTNLVFEPEGLEHWLEELDKRSILGKVFILAGITPIRSRRMAAHLHDRVPGVRLPEDIRKAFEKVTDDGQEELGVEIALKHIEAIRKLPGLSGLHLMSVGWEAIVPRIIEEAGLN